MTLQAIEPSPRDLEVLSWMRMLIQWIPTLTAVGILITFGIYHYNRPAFYLRGGSLTLSLGPDGRQQVDPKEVNDLLDDWTRAVNAHRTVFAWLRLQVNFCLVTAGLIALMAMNVDELDTGVFYLNIAQAGMVFSGVVVFRDILLRMDKIQQEIVERAMELVITLNEGPGPFLDVF